MLKIQHKNFNKDRFNTKTKCFLLCIYKHVYISFLSIFVMSFPMSHKESEGKIHLQVNKERYSIVCSLYKIIILMRLVLSRTERIVYRARVMLVTI